MLATLYHGITSVVLRVRLRHATTGLGLIGLAHDSAGLKIGVIADNEAGGAAYTAAGGTLETIATLGTYAAPTATKCRFKAVDAINHPGLYELQLADARFAVPNAKSLRIAITGAANLLDFSDEVLLGPSNITHVNGVAILGGTPLVDLAAPQLPAVGSDPATWTFGQMLLMFIRRFHGPMRYTKNSMLLELLDDAAPAPGVIGRQVLTDGPVQMQTPLTAGAGPGG